MNKHQITTTSLIMLIPIVGVISILICCFITCIITKHRNRHRRNEVQINTTAGKSTMSSLDHASKQATLGVIFSKAMDSVSLPIDIQE